MRKSLVLRIFPLVNRFLIHISPLAINMWGWACSVSKLHEAGAWLAVPE